MEKKIKNLKYLSLMGCGAESLNFPEDLTILENFELELDFAKENQKSIETIDVNLEKLKYIKKITVCFIFRLLPCSKIGLSLMDTLIMAPEKSVTAFIGLGNI